MHTPPDTGDFGPDATRHEQIAWITTDPTQDQSSSGLIRIAWGDYRIMIVSDTIRGRSPMIHSDKQDLNADVLVLPGQPDPVRPRYRSTLQALIPAVNPRLIILCDGNLDRFASTLDMIHSLSSAPTLSTHQTGALTFILSSDGALMVQPYYKDLPSVRIDPAPDSLQISTHDMKRIMSW